ncbi:MAG: SusE domain-containing protein [Chitinophagaceae bacterium]|nr:SusE domain-containing protein [Chitinophagaceae bacterium]
MKSIIRFTAFFILTGIAACKKVENKIYFGGGTAPVVSANTNAVRLEPGEEGNLALRLNWTNPDYKFTTGTSSQDVNYTLEIDTLGANFGSKNKYVTVIAKELTKSFTVAELNDIMGNTILIPVGLSIPRKTYTFQVRITSGIGSAVKLVSNVLTFTARPFAPPPKVDPPASNELFITGEATPANWMSGGDAPVAAQKFTKVSDTYYMLNSIRLNGGKEFLLVPRYGNWSAVSPDPEKYGSVKLTKDMNPFGDEFQRFGNNHKSPPETGNYKIEVNFQTGKTTLTKLP